MFRSALPDADPQLGYAMFGFGLGYGMRSLDPKTENKANQNISDLARNLYNEKARILSNMYNKGKGILQSRRTKQGYRKAG